MTCIAWDGKTLAADKRCTICGLPQTTTKIHRVQGALVGFAGMAAQAEEMLDWLECGADPELFPASQRDSDEACDVLLIQEDGKVVTYQRTPYPVPLENPFFAIGSGRDYAIAAMHFGKTAREAVELASLYCVDCGNGVDELTL